MSLRIVKSRRAPAPGQPQPAATTAAAPPSKGDDWISRLAKLIPAEALGLYGSLVAAVPGATRNTQVRVGALWVIALLCLGFSAWLRMKATQGQVKAVLISLVSFAIWLVAIGPPNSPIPPLAEDYRFVPTVVAIAWAALISQYQGDDAAPPPA